MSQRPGGGQSTPGRPRGSSLAILLGVGIVVLACLGAAVRLGPTLLDRDARHLIAAAAPTGTSAATSSTSTGATAASAGRTPSAEARPPVTPTTTKPRTRPTVPVSGPGTYRRAAVTGRAAGRTGRIIRFDVRVEKGLPVGADEAARLIQQVLNDKRSWRGSGTVRFQVVASARHAALHAYLVTPKTTDRLCAPLLTRGQVSCQNGDRVVLNARRWVFGAKAYGSDVAEYRRYLINHEFGHALGHQHVRCAGPGRRAGVMMQQTKGLRGCRANPWPFPGP